MRVLIMGPPGAGKGTQAERISVKYCIPAISTGDMFRANVAAGTQLGLEAKKVMDAGGYVNDDITNGIVRDRLSQDDVAPGFLLDGYPRTLAQVSALDEFLASCGKHLDHVLSLVVCTDAVVERLRRRASQQERTDDTEAAIRIRQTRYADETRPLLKVYANYGLLREVDGLGSVDEVSERIFTALG